MIKHEDIKLDRSAAPVFWGKDGPRIQNMIRRVRLTHMPTGVYYEHRYEEGNKDEGEVILKGIYELNDEVEDFLAEEKEERSILVKEVIEEVIKILEENSCNGRMF